MENGYTNANTGGKAIKQSINQIKAKIFKFPFKNFNDLIFKVMHLNVSIITLTIILPHVSIMTYSVYVIKHEWLITISCNYIIPYSAKLWQGKTLADLVK